MSQAEKLEIGVNEGKSSKEDGSNQNAAAAALENEYHNSQNDSTRESEQLRRSCLVYDRFKNFPNVIIDSNKKNQHFAFFLFLLLFQLLHGEPFPCFTAVLHCTLSFFPRDHVSRGVCPCQAAGVE